MKRLRFLWPWAMAGAGIGASGCASSYQAPFQPPAGIVFAQFRAPLQTEFAEGGVACSKQPHGSATSWYVRIPFLWIDFAWEDCSIAKATKNGNLKEVAYADYEMTLVLGIIGKTTVNAYGPRK